MSEYGDNVAKARHSVARQIGEIAQQNPTMPVDSPIVTEALEQRLFRNPKALFSAAGFTYDQFNGSYYLSQVKIPSKYHWEDSQDDYIILAAKRGNEAAVDKLLKRHGHTLERIVSGYFSRLSDRDDFISYAMKAFFEAVQDYIWDSPFNNFLCTVVRRELIAALKTDQREKRRGDVAAVSFEDLKYHDGSEGGVTYGDTISTNELPPDLEASLALELQERLALLRRHLSPLQYDAYILQAHGYSYSEIASALGRTVKSVDNALARTRRRISSLLSSQ